MARDPLAGRPGLSTDHAHPLSAAAGRLVRDHGLHGVVLVEFSGDRVGVTSSGAGPTWSAEMRILADRILAAIDDGRFDPDPQPEGVDPK